MNRTKTQTRYRGCARRLNGMQETKRAEMTYYGKKGKTIFIQGRPQQKQTLVGARDAAQ
jgi:hypothetical protein